MANFHDLESMRAAAAAAKVAAKTNPPLSKRDLMIGGPHIRYRSYERASDAETDASVESQRRHNDRRAKGQEWTRIEGNYVDNNRPASWRAKPGSREDYERLLLDMAEDPGDVLVFFEMARSSRDLEVYVKLRKFCAKNGPHFWQVGDSLFDVRDASDRQALNSLASQAEGGSDAISRAVSPAMEEEAEKGRPHGTPPFGYVRGPRPSKKTPPNQSFDDDMTGRDWCPADVVREIFATYHDGESMTKLAQKYNRSGIPTPRKYLAVLSGDPERITKTRNQAWTHTTFRHLLGNHHYIGVRMRKGLLVTEDAIWEPLIDKEVFFAVQRRRAELKQTGRAPCRAKSLLSYLAVCGCGDRGVFHHPNKGLYTCRSGDMAISKVIADKYVEDSVVAFFDQPEVAERFQPDDSEERRVAAERAARIREELDGWRKVAQDPMRTDYGLSEYNAYAETVLPELYRLEKEATNIEASPAVKKMLGGGGAMARWEGLTLQQQREVLNTCWRIEIHRVGKGNMRVPVEERVTMTAIF